MLSASILPSATKPLIQFHRQAPPPKQWCKRLDFICKLAKATLCSVVGSCHGTAFIGGLAIGAAIRGTLSAATPLLVGLTIGVWVLPVALAATTLTALLVIQIAKRTFVQDGTLHFYWGINKEHNGCIFSSS